FLAGRRSLYERLESSDVPADCLCLDERVDFTLREIPAHVDLRCASDVLDTWLREHVLVVDGVVEDHPRTVRLLLQRRDNTVEADGSPTHHSRVQMLLHHVTV